MHDLTGKVCAITGGASGIGRALADVEAGPLALAVRELGERGVNAMGFECDVADAAQVEAFAAATFDRFDTAHIIANNAGVGGGIGRAWEVSPEGWDWTISVNLMGVVNGLRAFVPRLVEQNDGHVINTASLAGLKGSPMMAPYVASKHAVVGISECLVHDFTISGAAVGVSVLCPAFIRTRIAESGRNWPGRLGTSPLPSPESPSADFIRTLVEAGMEPADYAARVLDAVETNRFFVLSDDAHAGAILSRHDEAVTGRPPTIVSI